MKIYYPPIGIAHITSNLSDLVADRLNDTKSVRIACVSQPKSDPHFGTLIVILCAFSIAKLFRQQFAITPTVLFDTLENAPGRTLTFNKVEYTLALSHQITSNTSSAELYLKPILKLISWLSKKTNIEFNVRTYRDIQAQLWFRHGLKFILNKQSEFIPIMSPSEHRLRIRPICLKCGLVDKAAKTVMFDNPQAPEAIFFNCPNHGRVETRIDDLNNIIDSNAPIRTVLRSFCFYKDRIESDIETVIVNGGDWAGAWMQRVYFDGLALFNCVGKNVPFNIFTPQILDPSGAKISKTIYLEKGAYAELNKAWLSYSNFIEAFGEDGLNILWNEVEAWINSPAKFFRNYSISYFENLFQNR
jgi:hypothetical protein